VTGSEHEPGPVVRPYAITGGRTRSQHAYPLEALVVTSLVGQQHGPSRSPEARAICELCTKSRSIAEVAAHLRVPVGVVRVLIGDLAEDGVVLVHEGSEEAPDNQLLERVLSGLRRL
jgi:Protein of unknown function (DUF742)